MSERKPRDLNKYARNQNVEKVTGSNLKFKEEFKLGAIRQYKSGKTAKEIFIEAGLDLKDFGKDYAKKSIARWLRISKAHGASKLNVERRGINASGRPGNKKFKSANEELVYLRAENEFLKKLQALEKIYLKNKKMK
jgi:hypothetical protein